MKKGIKIINTVTKWGALISPVLLLTNESKLDWIFFLFLFAYLATSFIIFIEEKQAKKKIY